MPALLLCLVRFLRLLLSGHQAVAIENAGLRLQLAAFRRKRRRPVLTIFDRLFWVGLSRVWRGWVGLCRTFRQTRSCAGSGSAFAGSGRTYPEWTAGAAAGPRPPSRFAVSSSGWWRPNRLGGRPAP